jgi:hypothetical protein
MAMQSYRFAVDGPVWIALNDGAIGMIGQRTTAWVADAGERFTHYITLCCSNRRHLAAMAGGIA